MNREFEEETGTSLIFNNEEDFCFSFINFVKPIVIQMTSVYCRTTSDLKFFNSILSNFHSGLHLVVDTLCKLIQYSPHALLVCHMN